MWIHFEKYISFDWFERNKLTIYSIRRLFRCFIWQIFSCLTKESFGKTTSFPIQNLRLNQRPMKHHLCFFCCVDDKMMSKSFLIVLSFFTLHRKHSSHSIANESRRWYKQENIPRKNYEQEEKLAKSRWNEMYEACKLHQENCKYHRVVTMWCAIFIGPWFVCLYVEKSELNEDIWYWMIRYFYFSIFSWFIEIVLFSQLFSFLFLIYYYIKTAPHLAISKQPNRTNKQGNLFKRVRDVFGWLLTIPFNKLPSKWEAQQQKRA